MAPKRFDKRRRGGEGGGVREIKCKSIWKEAVEEQPSCERKVGSH